MTEEGLNADMLPETHMAKRVLALEAELARLRKDISDLHGILSCNITDNGLDLDRLLLGNTEYTGPAVTFIADVLRNMRDLLHGMLVRSSSLHGDSGVVAVPRDLLTRVISYANAHATSSGETLLSPWNAQQQRIVLADVAQLRGLLTIKGEEGR